MHHRNPEAAGLMSTPRADELRADRRAELHARLAYRLMLAIAIAAAGLALFQL